MTTPTAPAALAFPTAIVIAWTEEVQEVVRPGVPDLGRLPVLRDALKPCAIMWLNKGGADDIEKAVAYARRVDGAGAKPYCAGKTVCVFLYPTTEIDPLSRAKIDILQHPEKAWFIRGKKLPSPP